MVSFGKTLCCRILKGTCTPSPDPYHSPSSISVHTPPLRSWRWHHSMEGTVSHKPWSHSNALYINPCLPLHQAHCWHPFNTHFSPLASVLRTPPRYPGDSILPFPKLLLSLTPQRLPRDQQSELISLAQAFSDLEALQDQGHGSENSWHAKRCFKQWHQLELTKVTGVGLISHPR